MSRVTELEALARFHFNTSRGFDHLAWAKRIIYREERGDKSLSVLQVKFAQMALDPQQQNKSK